MRTFNILTICLLAFFATNFASAQSSELQSSLEFKIQQMANGAYGVFVKPDHTIAPSGKTQTGAGQVTLVVPTNFTYSNFKNLAGTWVENARVDAPVEATNKSYVSFGFVVDNPRIKLFPNEETLLFTFTTDAAFDGQVKLFDNENDPFVTPNSYGSNPGNDLGVIDLGATGGMAYYTYARNYSTEMQEAIEYSTLATTNK
ncbi:MAG: hypothetical protein GC192_22405 [Bacteroidetes bacterium]|nr:hypothetical protein [Bacteroidota bacterium]